MSLVQLQLFEFDNPWWQVKDGHPVAAALYRRHYSCYQYADGRRVSPGYRNRNLICGPGEKMVLLLSSYDAVFVWRKFIDKSGQTGLNCAVFRNESPLLSSWLIKQAEKKARFRWPTERLYTYVAPQKIRSSNPGCCFKKAGWLKSGKTKSGLTILSKP